jgi:hypothetical protein
MKYLMILLLAASFVASLMIAGCSNSGTIARGPQSNQQNINQQTTAHTDTYLSDLPNEPLSQGELEALNLTLNDEYRAEAIYQGVIDKFGDVNPFSNIINAEQKHSDALIQIYKKYDLPVPENDWYDSVPEFDSVTEACAVGTEAENENVALYNELFSKVDNQDIIAVFVSLRDASLYKHLPAFERCS